MFQVNPLSCLIHMYPLVLTLVTETGSLYTGLINTPEPNHTAVLNPLITAVEEKAVTSCTVLTLSNS